MDLPVFDLNNWQEGSGGSWEYWYVQSGTLEREATTNPGCGFGTTGFSTLTQNGITVYPNPIVDHLQVTIDQPQKVQNIQLYNQIGKMVYRTEEIKAIQRLEMGSLKTGVYFVKIETETNIWVEKYFKM